MRALLFAVITIFVLPVADARADTPVFSGGPGVAIGGYDTVSYFTAGAPTHGQSDIAVMWKGATWLFVSEGNRQIFEANPRAYAPLFGGYCALGVAGGYIVNGDPTAWEIVQGQLYLTFDRETHSIWKRDVPGNIIKANGHWPHVLDY